MLPSDLRWVDRRSPHRIRLRWGGRGAKYVVINRFQLGRSMSSNKSMKRSKVIWMERGIG